MQGHHRQTRLLVIAHTEAAALIHQSLVASSPLALHCQVTPTYQQAREALQRHTWQRIICDDSILPAAELIAHLRQQPVTALGYLLHADADDGAVVMGLMRAGMRGVVKPEAHADLVRCVIDDLIETSGSINVAQNQKNELEFHSQALQKVDEGIYCIRVSDGTFVYANQKMEAMFGYAPDELLGQHVSIINNPDVADPTETAQAIMQQLHADGVWEGEVHNIRKDGTAFWCQVKIVAFEHAQYGSVWLSIQQDIDEQKAQRLALRASEARLKAMIESQTCYVVRTDLAGQYTYWNDKFRETFGWIHAGKDLRAFSALDTICEHHHQRTNETVARCIAAPGTVITVELDKPAPDGGIKTSLWEFICLVDADGQPAEMQCMGIEITERKAAENRLRESEQRFRTLTEHAHDVIIIVDKDGLIQYESPSVKHVLGYEPDAFIGQTLLDVANPLAITPIVKRMVHEEDQAALQACLAEGLDYPAIFSPIMLRIRHCDDSWRTVEIITNNLLRDPVIAGFVINIRDVTARKQAEELLRQSERRYRQMFELIQLPKLIIQPRTYRIIDANPAAVAFYGYSLARLKTMTAMEIILGSHETIETQLVQMMRGETARCDFVQQLADGTTRDVEAYFGLIEWDNQVAIYLVNIDVTTREMAQRAVQIINNDLEVLVAERTHELVAVKNQLEAIFDNSADGIVLLDNDLIIREANETCSALFGLAREAYLHRPITALLCPDDGDTFVAAMTRMQAGDKVERLDVCMAYRDDFFNAEINLSPFIGPGAETVHYVCNIRDVTARHAAQKALRESERLLRSLADNYPAYLALIERDYTVSWTAGAEYKKQGLEPHDFIGLSIEELFGDDADYIVPHYEKAFAGKAQSFEFARDGQHNLYRVVPLSEDDGRIERILVVAMNVDDLKQAEAQLRYLANIQAQMRDAVIGTDLDYNIVSWNKAAEEMYGWTTDDVMGQSLARFVVTEFVDETTLESSRAHLLQHGYWTGEVIQRRKDGTPLHVLASIITNVDERGNPIGIIGVNRDITERKHAEDAIRESEARYRLLAENVTDMISRHTPDGTYIYATPSAQQLTGYTPEELVGRSAYDFFYPDDMADIEYSHKTIMEQFQVYTVQYRLVRKDGHPRWVETTSHTIRDAHGEIVEIIAVTRDISERKAQQARLRVVSERLELATAAAEIGVWDWDIANDVLLWDDRMFEIYERNELRFENTIHSWVTSLHPEDARAANRDLMTSVHSDDHSNDHYSAEFRIVTPAGKIKHILASANIYRDDDGHPLRMVGINLDISETKAAEQALRSALAKERELGELKSRFVSMASHEFRTPLAAIMATAESLSRYRHRMSDEQIDKRLEKIHNQVDHMKNITEDVLQLARIQEGRQKFNPSACDFDALCREVIEAFDSQLAYRGRIIYSADEASAMALLDEQLMRQVVTNILQNALKYSPQESQVQMQLRVTADTLTLCIQDEGIGIPAEDQERLFQPFHRAKNVGVVSGTGLGLSIAKRAVDAHHGTIHAESQLGKGTTFTIMIPKVKDTTDDEDTGH